MKLLKKATRVLSKAVPLWAWILFCLGIASAVLYVSFIFSPDFADFFNEKIAAFHQRGLKIAAAKAVKALKKPMCIIYGALIVLGGAMRILFTAQPAAVLGRIVALSGIISFAAIFVVLRVLISCAVSIKRK